MRSKNPSFRQRPVSMAITLVLLNMYAAAAAADSKSWSSSDTCLSNWWSNSACWNPAGQPGDGDQVNLQRWGSDTRSRSVWYWNELHPDARLSELYVGGNGANVTLAQNFDHRLISNSEYIGLASSHLHAKGSNDIGTLEVGVDTPADRGGYYRLSGSANLKTSLAEVGFRGTGTFEQLGGTHSSHLLYLGTYAGDTGTYALRKVRTTEVDSVGG